QLLAVLDAPPLPAELDRNRRRHRQPSPSVVTLVAHGSPYPSPDRQTGLDRGAGEAVRIDGPHLDALLGQLRRARDRDRVAAVHIPLDPELVRVVGRYVHPAHLVMIVLGGTSLSFPGAPDHPGVRALTGGDDLDLDGR